ncbi:GxxExxY protein [Dokdonella sp.]|uniref:GxxExxY protein n=1 Tax=Dokdonella sp. TaxID=2291710 RepID=UPI0025BCFD4D|nr:GxxExxY protein [Dokdonella sp.]MBX3690213.1 GxxExxY protein [Dokdonella sp.]
MEFDELSNRVIGCAIEVHRQLGPGLLESVYQRCLTYELVQAGLRVETERAIGIRYKQIELNCGFRVDVLVEEELIVELKAVDALLPIHEAQLLTYLRLSGLKVGLLMNFNSRVLRNGVRRLVL